MARTVAEIAGRVTGGGPPNIFTTLGRHPRLFRAWLRYSARLMPFGSLPRRDTELVILRVAWQCRSAYEWHQHVAIALRVGLTPDEVAGVADASPAGGLHGAPAGAAGRLRRAARPARALRRDVECRRGESQQPGGDRTVPARRALPGAGVGDRRTRNRGRVEPGLGAAVSPAATARRSTGRFGLKSAARQSGCLGHDRVLRPPASGDSSLVSFEPVHDDRASARLSPSADWRTLLARRAAATRGRHGARSSRGPGPDPRELARPRRPRGCRSDVATASCMAGHEYTSPLGNASADSRSSPRCARPLATPSTGSLLVAHPAGAIRPTLGAIGAESGTEQAL